MKDTKPEVIKEAYEKPEVFKEGNLKRRCQRSTSNLVVTKVV